MIDRRARAAWGAWGARGMKRAAATLACFNTLATTLSCIAAAMPLAALAAPAADDAPTLAARYEALRPELSRSPFGRPLLLQATDRDEAPSGAVYAVLPRPFEQVATTLREPAGWCALMLLQTNIKACSAEGSGDARRLVVAVARRHTDAVEDAERIRFDFQVQEASAQRLAVSLVADRGPVGTEDYALRFEAVPVAPGRAFMHLTYAYRPGLAARLATSAYLATAGRGKVGFTVTGRDAAGQPQYVGGIRGIAERNTLRYFLAIETLLGTQEGPAEARLDRRLRDFHAALERYPAQLHELQLDEYLALKRREIAPAKV